MVDAHTSPRPDPDFIGRARALEALRAGWRQGTRLWTVVGPGGMGKTRLARYLLTHGPLDALGPAPRFCDASEVHDADSLVAAVIRAAAPELTATPTPGASADAGAALRRMGPSLFVLDNAEQLAPLCAELIPTWMERAPLLRLLVTSRTPLGVEGEAVYPLEALELTPCAEGGVPEAVELLVRRARLVRPGFEPSAEDIRALTGVAARLDGIPLALELAAARLGVLAPAELAERIERDLGALRDEHSERPARHATLRAAVEWSWALLSAPEQRALLRLSVFRGGATTEAAEHVLGADGALEPIDALAALARHSLVQVHFPRGAEYRLFESVRDFAIYRLTRWDSPVPESQARATHAAYFAEQGWRRGESWEVQGDLEAWRWLDAESDNLAAAADWALTEAVRSGNAQDCARASALVLALEPVLSARGPYRALLHRLDALLALPSLELPWQARARIAKGKLARQRGDARAAREELALAESCAERAAWEAGQARAALERGIAEHHLGHASEAAQLFIRAENAFARTGQQRERARAWGSLAVIRHEQGLAAEAEQLYEAALDVLREAGDARSQAVFLTNLGDLHRELGKVDLARAAFEEGLTHARAAGDRRVEGVLLGNLGGLEEDAERYEDARRLRLEAAAIQDDIGDRRTAAIFRGLSARVDHLVGDLEGARRQYRTAVRHLAEANDRRYESLLRANLALAAAQSQRPGEALSELALARERASELDEPQLRASLQAHAALVAWTIAPSEATRAAVTEQGEAIRALGTAAGDEGRFALVWVRRVTGEEAPPEALVVSRDVDAFRWGTRPAVSLTKRHVLRRVFARFAAARADRPGQGLAMDTIFEAGWPGERAQPAAAANRVYVAITTLRKLGLGDVLQNHESGWRLDPRVPFRWGDVEGVEGTP